MSGMESFSEDLLRNCVLRTYTIDLPTSTSDGADWVATLLSPEISQEAQDLTKHLARSRSALLQETLADSSLSHPELDVYLNKLNLLLDSLNSQATVKVYRPLSFNWSGSITAKPFRRFERLSEIIYEIVMVVWTKVIVTYRRGVSHLASVLGATAASPTDPITHAAKAFNESAGICKYLSTSVIPRWHNAARYDDKMPEASTIIAEAMAKFCTACAAQCVVAQALCANTAPSSKTLTKLCSAVAQSATESLDLFKSTPKTCLARVDPEMLTHSAYLREFFSAMSYFHSAIVAEKGAAAVANFGAAVTLLKQQGKASDQPTTQHDPYRPGLPKLSGEFALMAPALGAFLAYIKDKHETANIENQRIYYESPIDHIALSPPVYIMKCKVHEAPPVGELVYFGVVKADEAVDSKSDSASTTEKSAPALASASPALAPVNATIQPASAQDQAVAASAPVVGAAGLAYSGESDAEYAKRLQEEYNAESR